MNSYSRQHPLYKALKLFGALPKSRFILRYIDDIDYRQGIEGQLNKIEHMHLFSRAVSVGSPRTLQHTDKEEQEIAEACKRLIKNCLIAWNYLYISHKLDDLIPEERENLMQTLSSSSFASWGHFNLLGEYDFSDEQMEDSVGISPPKLFDQ